MWLWINLFAYKLICCITYIWTVFTRFSGVGLQLYITWETKPWLLGYHGILLIGVALLLKGLFNKIIESPLNSFGCLLEVSNVQFFLQYYLALLYSDLEFIENDSQLIIGSYFPLKFFNLTL